MKLALRIKVWQLVLLVVLLGTAFGLYRAFDTLRGELDKYKEKAELNQARLERIDHIVDFRASIFRDRRVLYGDLLKMVEESYKNEEFRIKHPCELELRQRLLEEAKDNERLMRETAGEVRAMMHAEFDDGTDPFMPASIESPPQDP